MAVDPWDPSQPTAPQAFDQLADRASRAAAAQRSRVGSDANTAPVRPEYDKTTGLYVYETLPVPIKQSMGSPLAQSGTFANGPQGARLLTSGWGDAPPAGLRAVTNQALDFAAELGEPVYATAKGIVRFTGFQGQTGFGAVDKPHADNAKQEVLDSQGNVVAKAATNDIAYGGIAVWIGHTDEFGGYQTEYYRLGDVIVENGATVQAGDVIGHVGATGGRTGWAKDNFELRFQAAFTSGSLRSLVPPTTLVPNYWPGHLDSSNTNAASIIIMPLVTSVGGQVAASRVANVISSFNRATAIQNKGVAEVNQDKADHAARTAQTVEVQRTAIYTAQAAFQGKPPVVTAPMTFDFTNGVWLVNGQDDGAT